MHDLELTVSHLFETRKQSALEEAEEPEPEPKGRAITVSELTEGLGLLKLALWFMRILIRTSSNN